MTTKDSFGSVSDRFSLLQGFNLHAEEEKKKLKVCKALIQDTAKILIRKINEESHRRVEAFYENMKKTVDDINQSLSTISQLEDTLLKYSNELGISIAGNCI